MTTPVIIDIVVIVVLVGFTTYGARRGLLRALTSLLVVVVALVGAGIVAATFTQPVTKLVTPLIADHIEKKVDAVIENTQAPVSQDGTENFSVEDLLALLGLDQEMQEALAEQAEEKIEDTGATIAMAVVDSLAQSIIYAVLYMISFVGLSILLRVLLRAMDLVLQLPGLHLLNSLGGAAVGLVEGMLLLFLVVWVLRRMGVSFETEALASAHILQIFTSNTPLSVLTFLR